MTAAARHVKESSEKIPRNVGVKMTKTAFCAGFGVVGAKEQDIWNRFHLAALETVGALSRSMRGEPLVGIALPVLRRIEPVDSSHVRHLKITGGLLQGVVAR